MNRVLPQADGNACRVALPGDGNVPKRFGMLRGEVVDHRHEILDVLRPLPQGRQLHGEGTEAKQQVLSELAALDHGIQIPVRGRDQSEITTDFRSSPNLHEPPLLQKPSKRCRS